MKKLFITLALSFLILPILSNQSIEAKAEDHEHIHVEANEIMPRAQLCPCGNGEFYVYNTNDTGMVYAGQTDRCIHGKRGNDARYTRTVTYFRKCSSCGRSGPTTSTTTEEIRCQGW